jgi:predicted TPR repeat methyltransferase
MHVAEIGCSAGYWSERLKLDRYTGIDFSPESIATGRERYPEHTFIEADLSSYQGLDAFDYVISHQCLFFLDRGSVERLLGQVKLITLQEPTRVDLGMETVVKPQDTGADFYIHPYRLLAQQAGLTILTHRHIEIRGNKKRTLLTARAA